MLKNSHHSYGWLAIVIHWFSALLIFGMFGLGLYMVELTYYDAWYKGSLDLHKSVGVIFMCILLLRMAWRFVNVVPDPSAENAHKLEALMASIAHKLLYFQMCILVFSGYLISTADGRSVEVFALFSTPALSIAIDNQEDIAGVVHEWVAWSLIFMVIVHVLAALKHHFISKNNTLVRMLKVRN